ncbi:MAG: hypothetical protein KGI80_03945 [Verrucomicrobiota bacterium]|nr:hypothetical protein [Verrucomicrobiota bacterium]
MKSKYVTLLIEMLESPTAHSPEKLNQLTEETMAFFGEMKKKMDSPDEAVRKEAMEDLARVRELLEKKLKELAEKTGLTPHQIAAFTQTMLAPQKQEALQSFSEKVQGVVSPVMTKA